MPLPDYFSPADPAQRDSLARAELLRRDLQFAIETYTTRLDRFFASLRSLRAWQIMLALNKSYVLLTTRGWKGRWEWIAWVALIPLQGFTGLRAFEPQPPDIAPLLPIRYNQPLFDPSASVSAAPTRFPASSVYDVLIFGGHPSVDLIYTLTAAGHRVFLINAEQRESASVYNIRKEGDRQWNIVLPSASASQQHAGELTSVDRLNLLFLDAGIPSAALQVLEPEWLDTAKALADCWHVGPLVEKASPAKIAELVSASTPKVSVIVVTYNSEQYIQACIESIVRHGTYPALEIVCVDNGSVDKTVPLLNTRAASEPRIRVIALDSNLGFAAANNVGVRACNGNFIVLLNADTVVTAGWLERLLWHLKEDPQIGILNPVTNSAGNEAMITCSYRTPAELEQFAETLARDRRGSTTLLEVCPLFCAAIPRRVWDLIGELDEQFGPGTFEDDDYSLRVAQSGLRLAAAEDCFVHHFGQGAFSQLPPQQFGNILTTNRGIFERKWRREWRPHRKRPGVFEPGGQLTPEAFRTPEARH